MSAAAADGLSRFFRSKWISRGCYLSEAAEICVSIDVRRYYYPLVRTTIRDDVESATPFAFISAFPRRVDVDSRSRQPIQLNERLLPITPPQVPVSVIRAVDGDIVIRRVAVEIGRCRGGTNHDYRNYRRFCRDSKNRPWRQL